MARAPLGDRRRVRQAEPCSRSAWLASSDALARVDGESELIVVVERRATELRGAAAARCGRRRRRAGARVRGRRQRRARGCPRRVDRARERRLRRRAGRARRAARRRRDATSASASVAAQVRFAATAGHDQLGRPRGRRARRRARARGSGSRHGSRRRTATRAGRGLRRQRRACALYRRAMLDDRRRLRRARSSPTSRTPISRGVRAWPAGAACSLPRAVALHHHSATLGHGSSAQVPARRPQPGAHAREERDSAAQLRRRLLRDRRLRPRSTSVTWPSTARTLAPLTGRLRGLAEWRAYRAGRPPGPARARRCSRRARAARRRSCATASTRRGPGSPGAGR